jgi:PucR C-terminal helix-turn-helix domain/GGDEF-like domain
MGAHAPPDAVATHRSTVPSAVRDLADAFLARTAELGRGMADHLWATMPELAGSDDDELREETRASCESNVEQVLRLLRLGADADALVMPAQAAGFARSFVHRGITLPALLRSYRLGHAWLWEQWSHALGERIDDPAEHVSAQDLSSAFMFAYVDRIADDLVAEYGTERERMVRGAAQLRAETVRQILRGDVLDEELAVGRLGYELRRHHVAMRVSSVSSEVRGLERAAVEAAGTLGRGEPLIVPSGAASLDLWWGSYTQPVTDALERYVPPDGVRVAFGAPAEGVAGFRRSHGDAVQAARVAALAGAVAAAVTSYSRVELVSLLAGDLPRARSFVAGQLGPLASTTEQASRLRETVLAFLASGGSGTRVARDLYVHQNTVAYRVKRAEELLGRRVTERPIELTCALTLAAVLGRAVLADDDDSEQPQ